jgi:hypothetical protein
MDVLDVETAAAFLAEVVERKALDALVRSGVAIHGVRRVPFAPYPGSQLQEVSVRDRSGRAGYLTLLQANDTLTHLNGASAPIHDLNARGALRLASASEACDYLRLFCHVVMGDEGAWTILERADQVHTRATMPDAQRAEVLALACAPQVESEGHDERHGVHYILGATVKYGTAVFEARFRLQASGMIEMIGNTPKLGDLEAGVEIVLDGLRMVVERSPNQSTD